MIRKAFACCALLAGGIVSSQAMAGSTASPSLIASDAPFGAAAALSGDQLMDIRGAADLNQIVTAANLSNVANNSVNGNSITGTIGFDNSSFQGMNGLSIVSANTGNNVSINSSLNVNVAFRP